MKKIEEGHLDPHHKRRQGFNDKLDESLGMRKGKKKQSMKSRRHESEGMEKSMGKRMFGAVKSMNRKRK